MHLHWLIFNYLLCPQSVQKSNVLLIRQSYTFHYDICWIYFCVCTL